MYYLDGQFYQLGLKQKISFFAISLMLNSFGNGLSVATASPPLSLILSATFCTLSK
ncbi:hypothetical protein GQS40_12565|uniref:Uncharacterized protein n=1 Tax=Leuconostoc lactis TaxID=1246 RepID=A0A6L7AE36_LEULA|nr:hypothetical protein [Leuconostoc lactis]